LRGFAPVFADVSLYRDFVLDATPTWAPTQRYAADTRGSARVGKTLECLANGRESGTHRRYEWRLFCFVTAYNDGGEILVGVDGVRAAG